VINTIAQRMLAGNLSPSVGQMLRSARIMKRQRMYKLNESKTLSGLPQRFRIKQALEMFAALF